MPKPGTVFQLRGRGYHFWIVISRAMNGKVLTVNATGVNHCPYSPCRLDSTDHSAFTKPSAISYRRARLLEEKALDDELAAQQLVRQLADCSEELLERIIEGAQEADDLTASFLKYLE